MRRSREGGLINCDRLIGEHAVTGRLIATFSRGLDGIMVNDTVAPAQAIDDMLNSINLARGIP